MLSLAQGRTLQLIASETSRIRCQPSHRLALFLIRLYQVHLLPLKGFSCPYRLSHQRNSCSSYISGLVETADSWSVVLIKYFRRLQECAAASLELTSEGPQTKCWVIPCCFPLLAHD
jgi:putative component of membrane protein insertase Oxa1/YidC/SpoIIIJ protein YidD